MPVVDLNTVVDPARVMLRRQLVPKRTSRGSRALLAGEPGRRQASEGHAHELFPLRAHLRDRWHWISAGRCRDQ